MLTDNQILEYMERHKMQAHISARQHFCTLQKKLGADIAGKKRIYLDTKYWVLLRDADLGRAKNISHTEILALLRDLVSKQIAICPISDAAYVESMQQTDQETRLATAALMDELSCGVALAVEMTRIQRELLDFVVPPASAVGGPRLDVWVKAGFVLGETVPRVDAFDDKTNLFTQKSFIDLIWHQSVFDYASQDHDRKPFSMQATADSINQKMVEYADQIRSFEQAATAEFSGSVKQFDNQLASDALAEMGYLKATAEELDKYREAMQTCLFNALRLRPEIVGKLLPTLFIHAMCHAAVRWNKIQKLDSHWLLDIHHACAGVAYHHAMFTEHALRTMLANGKMRMGERFGTHILSAEQDVIRYLKSLTAPAFDQAEQKNPSPPPA